MAYMTNIIYLVPLLPIWIELILSWIGNHIHNRMRDEIIYSFWNINSATDEVSEWIGNFISDFIIYVITYPCWDL